MLQAFFHAWERRLADVTKDRVVRPFEWGLDWIPENGHSHGALPADAIGRYVSDVMADTDAFFTPPPINDYTLQPAPDGDLLTFPSALVTPHESNNTVRCRYFPAPNARAAVLVMPQWNSDAGGHVGLCKLLAMNGMSALRLSLPYHDQRMPPELHRADYIVSANVMRTLQVCRQAVLDARRAIGWLHQQGFKRIGILGTSLGSCLAMLTAAHEPLVRTAALNHISPYFADVIWEGLSTEHVRASLDGQIQLDTLRRIWMPISPFPYLERVRGKQVLLVYARYDLTFPVTLSKMLVDEFGRRNIDHEVAVLPCGHYSTGITPFKWMDGLLLCRFLNRAL
jgi:dienelactone hydrolase